MSKTAIVSGASGQTGSYLVESLLSKGIKVIGLLRQTSSFSTSRIDHILDHENFKLVYADLTDCASIFSVVGDVKPDYFYHLGAHSFVKNSFDLALQVADVTGLGTLRCLEAIKQNSPKTRFLHAATSELFGGESPEAYNEKSPMKPRSPYGCSKLFSYATTVNYKESYNLFAVNSISFNHESPRRKNVFISAKIISAACRIAKGLQDSLVVGNTSAMRDWSHAMDVCEAMQLILNADTPQDYVIASGESRSVEEFIRLVFGKLNLDYDKHVKISSKYYRPAEVQYLKGDSSKIRNELGWSPKYTFEMLVDEMIEYEMKEVEKELLLKGV